MKIYIAGKITGDKFYKIKFFAAETILRAKGHSIMDPAWIKAGKEFTHKDYMNASRGMQSACEAVYFLQNWITSKGAIDEYNYATEHNQKKYYRLKDIPKKIK